MTNYERHQLPDEGVPRLNPKDYDVRTEDAAREALARVAASGTAKEKEIVREAVQRYWPNIGREPDARSHFRNSNHTKD